MSTIDEIKERINIVDLVAEYVPDLKKAGHNYRALCPFHSEKTPSFFVFPDRQSWHCFGSCSTGGDIFAFIMKKEGVDFTDALRILAQKAGVTLVTEKKDATSDEYTNLYDLNQKVSHYYHHLLITEPAAESARNYLKRRGVSDQSIEDFQLGFSLNSWDTLQSFLVNQGALHQGSDLGLVIERDKGGYYDRFRGHIMFPICNKQGKITGFGARVLDDSIPKYVNSPQSLIFDKSSELYGIERAYSSVNKLKQVIIVEGYMDVIIAHQYGFNNVVASMGTALNDKKIDVLRKLTNKFILAMDSDEAGKNAARKGLESAWLPMESIRALMSASKYKRMVGGHYYTEDLRVMIMPPGKDPDDVIKENKDDWQKLIDGAHYWPDAIIEIIAPEINSNDAKSKSSAVDKVLPFLSAIPDPIERSHYLQKLARLVGVNEETLITAANKLKTNSLNTTIRTQDRKNTKVQLTSNPGEDYCLTLLLRYPVLRAKGVKILPEYFSHTENRELFLLWQNASSTETLLINVEMPVKEHLNYLVNKNIPPMSDKDLEIAFDDSVRHLREQHLRDLKLKEAFLFSDPDVAQNIPDMDVVQQEGLTHNTQLRDLFNQNKESELK